MMDAEYALILFIYPTFSAAAMSPPTELTNAIRLPSTPISAPFSATHFGVIPAMFCLLMLASELAKRGSVPW
jgi:hypothetical protein